MTATFTPRPGAAPMPRMIRTHAVMETRLLLRNGEQVLLALVIPVLALLVGAYGPLEISLDVLVPGVLALAVMSTSFTSLAIATGFERRYGVLKRLGASPLTRTGLLAGKALALFLVELLQFAVIAAVALGLGWRPGGSLAAALTFVVVGTLAFSGLGLAVAGTLRAEATLAAANLVYVVLLVGGAVVVPSAAYPDALRPVVRFLPSAALADGLRAGLDAGVLDLRALLVLVIWAAVGAGATVRLFRWE